MTQCRLLLTLWLASLLLSTTVGANEQYNQGSEFAKGIKGQEQTSIGGFDPAGVLPSYTSAPPESGYYGGATNASTDLTSQGNAALHQSEVGKTITESILNTPAGNKPSMDAPFISVGTDAQDKAESVTDGSFDGCVEQQVTHTEYTNHVCSRDTQIDQYCARTATIEGDWVGSTRDEVYVIPHSSIKFARGTFSFTSPASGIIKSATIQTNVASGQQRPSWVEIWNSTITWFPAPGVYPLSGAPGFYVNHGTEYTGRLLPGKTGGLFEQIMLNRLNDGTYTIQITFTISVNDRKFNPKIVWRESCPFDKAEGALTNSQCTEPGGNRTIYVEGQPYTMYSDCWAYKDTYLTQAQSEGSCREYMNNPACTIANRQCAYTLDGFCLHENLTYSCEHKTSGAGVMCGGTFFCKDGSCAQSAAGKNNAFQKAVSQLAAVAAAGKDVAELNGQDVRAFTGKAQFCKKFAAGFSNCCKDSGWGQDVGLASCSSEEKALGEARQRKLTVDVGEFCSKKALGVCIEKKRGYCVFESKLAQIVQQQGRQWQLGVGFGGASSPDCRGITMDELQNIKFDNLDFSNFFEDLLNGTTIPEDNALLQRAQQQIKEQVNNHAGGTK
ncbi:TPA: type-F conjugative transfer system mating-pair stabilization protein TraN [Aeromonas hydrophila]|uniref:type-F conjugative transfer system mating-pair stabilization protein TraN n=1 Tax=Aeromonas hydrophila TaxID=644 RepID=UPI001A198C77|nr:type-F conjugative transfer system mating-pair stabilization protein TraN [Aeromonas hydrophila]HAT2496815.1 type-F conjugative transfer system mating-pair stabilization protein TraN [Aeromonas hydrophila]HAT2512577.1 type-F conjugative transfer system mating-pair stabilization protein TraN [Aeromonas hydrophila]HAT2533022.1 type-F conjugative transfer system mating-pair stabilization protein TraN [Aeromonas hydrophila]HDX8371630.1 type-F conjugative transfer system mating-pair stabilization